MPQGMPYGDAFIVQTPALQNAANMLYRQQQQRLQMGYQDWQATQRQLQKEFANVRSADIGDVMKAYDEYKFAKQKTLFDPKVIHDKKAYAEAIQSANEKKAQLQQMINGSNELKEQDKNYADDIAKNRDLYTDNAGTTLAQWMQMPMTQRVKSGYIGNQPLLYQGTNTDFGKLEKDAAGVNQTTYLPEGLSADKLSYEQKGFSHLNNPVHFYHLYSGELAKRQVGKDASAAWQKIPDEVKAETEKEFNELPDSYWQGYGIPKPNLTQDSGQSNAEKFAILKAQQYALANEPQIADTKTRENKSAILDAQLKNEKTMEGLRQGNRMAIEKLKHQYRQADKQSQDGFLDGYIDQLKQDALKNPRDYKHGNTIEKQYAIKASPQVKQLFEQQTLVGGKNVKVYPDEIRFLQNGDVLPVYYLGSGKVRAVDTDLTKPISQEEFKLLLAKEFSTPSVNKAMGNEDDEEGDVAPIQNSKRPSLDSFIKNK